MKWEALKLELSLKCGYEFGEMSMYIDNLSRPKIKEDNESYKEWRNTMIKMYSYIVLQLPNSLKRGLFDHQHFKDLHKEKDPIELLKLIETLCTNTNYCRIESKHPNHLFTPCGQREIETNDACEDMFSECTSVCYEENVDDYKYAEKNGERRQRVCLEIMTTTKRERSRPELINNPAYNMVPRIRSPNEMRVDSKKDTLHISTKKCTKRTFTYDEKRAIEQGVVIHGIGNWKKIKAEFHRELQDRSAVDIKDCYRNIERKAQTMTHYKW